MDRFGYCMYTKQRGEYARRIIIVFFNGLVATQFFFYFVSLGPAVARYVSHRWIWREVGVVVILFTH